jgi:hypothetical protein
VNNPDGPKIPRPVDWGDTAIFALRQAVSLDNVPVEIARAEQLAKNNEARKKEKERLKELSEIGSILGLQAELVSRR